MTPDQFGWAATGFAVALLVRPVLELIVLACDAARKRRPKP